MSEQTYMLLDECYECHRTIGMNEAYCEACAAHAECIREHEREEEAHREPGPPYWCPECERPNQFGELCDRCRREMECA